MLIPSARTEPASIRVLTAGEQLAQLDSTTWDALVAAAPRPSPYLLSTWVRSWLAEPSFVSEPCVVVAERGGELAAVAPFVVQKRGAARIARFVGSHESALGDILLREGEPEGTARIVLDSVVASAKPDAVDVFGLPADSNLARAAGDRMTLVERVEAPVTEMPEGWDEAYVRHASSKRRSTDRRRERQLGELGDVDYSLASDGEGVLRDLPAAFELHRLRWEGRPDGSTFGTPGGQRFQSDVLPRLADEGHFAMLTVRIDGRPAAFMNWFVIGSCIYLYRNGYDEAVGRFGPGLITLRRAMAAASERGARRMEYLGGAERYKRELADRFDPMYQGYGLARGPVGHAYVARARMSIALRRRLKQSDTLHRLYRSGALSGRRSSGSGQDRAAA
jgi:CelD/BcsL family acetyltransferase involved in cellulose biosynthesis